MFYSIFIGGGSSTSRADATLLRLVSDLEKTDLGRKLTGFLAQQGYTVHVTNDFPKGHEDAAGLAMASLRRIYIRPGYNAAETLRIFAHETRHVGQFAAEKTLPRRFREYHPANRIAKAWLMEMDAEAFAAHFISNHERRVGDGVMWSLMGHHTSGWLADIYRAYMKEAEATSGRDGAAPMRAAFYKFLDDAKLRRSYANSALAGWSWDYDDLEKKTKLQSPMRHAFVAMAASSGGDSGRELLFERALLYSGIFTEFGAPDYLQGQRPADIDKKMNTGPELRENDAYKLDAALRQFAYIESRVKANQTPVPTGLLSRIVRHGRKPAEISIPNDRYAYY